MTQEEVAARRDAPEPPSLSGYETWLDEEGYHARLIQQLPEEALDRGCVQEIWAWSAAGLIQDATRNDFKVWHWETEGPA